MEMQRIIILYLLFVNLFDFALFGVDKWKAVHRKWRIREAVLLGCALAGGAAGGWAAMYLFRHKTHKPYFKIGMPVMLALQFAAGLLLEQV